jgi:hypothetical protein
MIISDTNEKGKTGLTEALNIAFWPLILILFVSAGIGGWRLFNTYSSEAGITMEYNDYGLAAAGASVGASGISTTSASTTTSLITGAYVASKNGKSYYIPTCAAASRILEKNRIWFNSKEEAEKAGYLPAKNCKGL